MQALNLPEPIAAYFRADAGSGLAVAHCFTPDGWVRDEGHTHGARRHCRLERRCSGALHLHRSTAPP